MKRDSAKSTNSMFPSAATSKLIMTSQDVIHSFYVPAFRIKQDVLPGRYTTAWFRATKPGIYHLFCAEYCGTAAFRHDWRDCGDGARTVSGMARRRPALRIARGERRNIFQQLGCPTCHRSDVQGRGPNLMGVFGKPVLLEDGRTVMADENYIRESILSPAAKSRERI